MSLSGKESGKQVSRIEAEAIYMMAAHKLRKEATLFIAGSYRRNKKVVNDIDLVAVLKNSSKEFFAACTEAFGSPLLGGKEENKKGQFLFMGVLLDFYLSDDSKLAPMLLFLTGSAFTNKRMRGIAKEKKLALNQYGLFKRGTDELYGAQTETGIFESLGLVYLAPSER